MSRRVHEAIAQTQSIAAMGWQALPIRSNQALQGRKKPGVASFHFLCASKPQVDTDNHPS
jgi:hypothetical protein